MGKSIMTHMHKLIVFVAIALAINTAPALSKTRAVLVGISDYYNLGDEFDLAGPRNDVREFSKFLLEKGVDPSDIVVLTDPKAGLDEKLSFIAPIRSNILSALDDLAGKSQKGDKVIFYFSGHGSLQPDDNGDEQGGSDEIFLPADVGKWNGSVGSVENAIVDDELREKMLAIRKTGAALFAVIDACHAATGFRGSNAVNSLNENSRFVPESALSIPIKPANISQRVQPPTVIKETDDTKSEYVYFYATQADQRAYEHPIVNGAKSDQWFGDFTLNLLKVMRRSPNASYRQVLQAVQDKMRGRIGAKPQQPDFEGTMLDQPMWAKSATKHARRYKVINGKLQAGILNNIGNGSIIALYAKSDDEPKKLVAHARTSEAGASEASLNKTKFPCSKDCGQAGELPANALYGEVISRGDDHTVTFSYPIFPAGQSALAGPLDNAIRALVTDRETPFKFDEADFDISLIMRNGALIIGGPNAEFDTGGPNSSVRFMLPKSKSWAEHLPVILGSVARVHTLYKMSEVQSDELDLLATTGGGLTSRLFVSKATNSERTKARCPRKRLNQSDNIPAQALDSQTTSSPLSHCDRVMVVIENRAVKPQDVTILYVDASFGISALWPTGGKSNRIAYGEKVSVPIQIVTRTKRGNKLATGQERIVIFSVPVDADTASRTVLTALSQPGITTRGSASVTEKYLRKKLYPQVSSRGLFDDDPAPPLNIKIHDILIVQPDQL